MHNPDFRILCVDDHTSQFGILEAFLKDFDLAKATSFTEAIQLVRLDWATSRSIKVVITDFDLGGGKHGDELLKSVWLINPDMRGIIISHDTTVARAAAEAINVRFYEKWEGFKNDLPARLLIMELESQQ